MLVNEKLEVCRVIARNVRLDYSYKSGVKGLLYGNPPNVRESKNHFNRVITQET